MAEKRKVTITYRNIANLESKFSTGAIGGITSNKLIYMNFFIDMLSMPKIAHQEINEDLTLGADIPDNNSYSDSPGIIREVHTSIQFNVEHAKAFVDWINQRIDEIKKYDEKNNI